MFPWELPIYLHFLPRNIVSPLAFLLIKRRLVFSPGFFELEWPHILPLSRPPLVFVWKHQDLWQKGSLEGRGLEKEVLQMRKSKKNFNKGKGGNIGALHLGLERCFQPFILRSFCPFCFILYLLPFPLFAVTFASMLQNRKKKRGKCTSTTIPLRPSLESKDESRYISGGVGGCGG